MRLFSQTFIILLMSVNFAFLDSGTGGLPYLKYLKAEKPDAACVYVGDTKNFPYGEKSREEIIEKACGCVEKIIEKWNPDAVVVACNTISVSALEELRRRFKEIPFIGTVPAIKPAAKLTRTKKIGLLATNATVSHPYTKKLISDFAAGCEVFSLAAPELISFIEHKYYYSTHEERLAAAKPSCDFFRRNGCDVIVLACTHFLNMTEEIKEAAGPGIQVVDSRDGVTRHAFDVVPAEKISRLNKFSSELYVTGFTESNDSQRYISFCRQNGIKFGGLLD